ncbi:alpha/beta hydrolase family protein [Actinomyces glycerinitolerans]|uniref:Serine aminopeptidase s33 n=1 Tax=Actinomyces glycerinitolerans TaxID=1892869 RepID=A0A1M4RVW0_9ACTO|nr:alpha/beta hydrolase [Actinomyces glycerinitolerans]SHE24125.1 serine aminopeptidase s33 [Actinomyces glycerinitolerans]
MTRFPPRHSPRLRRERLDVVSQGAPMEGVLTLPDAAGDGVGATPERRLPLVICCHGFTDSLHGTADVADHLAALGLATYRFTFNGGWAGADMTGMSVLTEVTDLEAVLDAARAGAGADSGPWAGIDPERIALLGKSQGGAVAMLTAARRPAQVAALVAWYPALCIADDLHRGLGSLDGVGETFAWMGQRLGRRYAEDVWDLDVYAQIGSYPGPTLIIHGTDDSLVPVAYGARAAETYTDARFLPIDGADHGFHGADLTKALDATTAHLRTAGLVGDARA